MPRDRREYFDISEFINDCFVFTFYSTPFVSFSLSLLYFPNSVNKTRTQWKNAGNDWFFLARGFVTSCFCLHYIFASVRCKTILVLLFFLRLLSPTLRVGFVFDRAEETKWKQASRSLFDRYFNRERTRYTSPRVLT